MKQAILILLALVMLLSMAACGQSGTQNQPAAQNPDKPAQTGQPSSQTTPDKPEENVYRVLRYGGSMEPANVDNQQNFGQVSSVLYYCTADYLWFYDIEGNTHFQLATGYELADDLSHLTVHLREGVKFHNGNDFTGEDVIFMLERAAGNFIHAAHVRCVDFEKTNCPDPYTVEIYFNEYNASFIDRMSTPPFFIWDKEWMEAATDEQKVTELNGTGPYYLDEWVVGTKYVLKRNDNYWGEKPLYDEVDIFFIPEPATRMMEFELGNLDICEVTQPSTVTKLANGGYDNSTVFVVPTQTLVGFKFQMNGPTADFWPKPVREAIAHAIDTEGICIALNEGSDTYKPATSSLSERNWAYQATGAFEYNPELSKKILADAGITNFEFTSGMYTSNPLQVSAAEMIQENLNQVGITMHIETLNASDWSKGNREFTNPGVLVSTSIGLDPWDMFNLWLPPSTSIMRAPEENTELIALLAEANTYPDEATRAAKFKQIQQIIHDEIYFIPVYESSVNYAVKTDLPLDLSLFDFMGSFRPLIYK